MKEKIKKSVCNRLRSKYFSIIVYNDEIELKERLIEYPMHIFINHDRDEVKPHYHFILKFENQRSLNSVAKELEIIPERLEVLKNYKASMLYLIHFNNKDKVKYSIDDCFGPLKPDLINFMKKDLTEDQHFLNIIEIIYSHVGYLRVTDFMKEICRLGLFSYVRRSYSIVSDILREHNENPNYFKNFLDI